MLYEEALREMQTWDDKLNDFTCEHQEVLDAARRALQDCLDMGLIGEPE